MENAGFSRIATEDFNLSFKSFRCRCKKTKIDVDYTDEGTFENVKWVRVRRLNGDDTTGGGDYGFGFHKSMNLSIKEASSI